MIEEMSKITIGGTEYPLKCSNLVLEMIQEEFGKLNVWEMGIQGLTPALDENGEQKTDKNGKKLFRGVETSIKAINFALPRMINEGIEIENEQNGTQRKLVSEKAILRQLDNAVSVAPALIEEYMKCFRRKNAQTTQNNSQTKKTTD